MDEARRDILLLAALALASATTDVLGFLAFGGVFTSAMTGNAALLGMDLGQGKGIAAARSLVALAGFLVGVAAATALGGGHRRGAVSTALRLEAACLLVFTAAWFLAGVPALVYALIALSGCGMGAQAVAARWVNLPAIPTVVFTSSLTSIVMAATRSLMRRRRLPDATRRQIGVFLTYLAGAVLAGALALWNLTAVALLPLAAVAFALAVNRRRARRPG
ncbi:MAG TPA: YoaK family protein [Stellaceae bacterium]|jgi:uncharacterized membrane protein YoaK (UPF0700 family)